MGLKINFILPGLFRSGGMRVIIEYANGFRKAGHDVILYFPYIPYKQYKGRFKPKDFYLRWKFTFDFLKGDKKPPKNFYKTGFQIQHVPKIKNKHIRDADVTIATSWPTAYSVNELESSKGKKFYFIQDYEEWYSDAKLVDKSYKLPLHRVTISKYLHNLFREKFGVESEVVLNGIDYNFFNYPEKKFNKNKVISFIDHPLDNKNSQGAIEVVKMIKKKFPDTEVMSFGYSQFHKLPKFVNFIENPTDEDIRNVYRNSDIFIYPCLKEGFALPPAEAMACKCAVVANKVGAIPEYSIDNETALLLEPGDNNGFHNAVKKLMTDEETLKKISYGGYEHIRKTLSWEKSIKKFEELFTNKN